MMARYIEESEVKRMIIRRGWMSEEELENSSVVADLPSAQQWIPVTERLPEPYCGDVLVTVNDGSVYVDVMAYDSPGDGHTYNSVFYTTDSDGYPNICEDVVAWMPLPAPWEGGEA